MNISISLGGEITPDAYRLLLCRAAANNASLVDLAYGARPAVDRIVCHEIWNRGVTGLERWAEDLQDWERQLIEKWADELTTRFGI